MQVKTSKRKLFSTEDKIKMAESTLRRVLAFAKKNPDTLVAG
jgi:hypothetical protein